MPVEFKDYYASLGVPADASEQDIRKAFRRLARKYHPDVAKDKKLAEEKFKEINEAYEVLSDPAKRRKYDTLGANWKSGASFEPPPGTPHSEWTSPDGSRHFEFHFAGTGFSDFFEQFFGGGSRFGGFEDLFRGGRRGPESHGDQEPDSRAGCAVRGADFEGNILVTLDEVVHGSVRSVSVRHANPNTGAVETQTFKVRLPAGVQDGQIIRVPAKGAEGPGGAPAGDLYLRVRLAAHPDFRPRGADLYHDLDLAPWEAVLGAAVSVPTLAGPVTVRIPAGTKPGQQLRVRGHGLPRGGGADRGDLHVVVNITLPNRLTEEERALWERLSRVSRFPPRSGSDSPAET